MKTILYELLKSFVLLLVLSISSTTYSQTTLSGGELTGILTKAGSPYTVTADLNVPKGQSLVVEPGVEMYFNQHIGIDVYGQITAQGTASDSIVFTASDTALGWYGIRIRKTLSENEEQAFSYCRFSYHFLIKHNFVENHGVLKLDSVNKVSISHCLFTKNKSAWGSGIKAWMSTVSLDNCVFQKNYAIDTNKLLANAIEGAIGSAASFGGSSNLTMNSCTIEDNKSYRPYYNPNDTRPNKHQNCKNQQ